MQGQQDNHHGVLWPRTHGLLVSASYPILILFSFSMIQPTRLQYQEALDSIDSEISPLDRTRQYLLKVREQKARIAQMEAQLAKEKAEAEKYTVAFLRNYYPQMVAEEWIELEPGVLGYLPLWEDEMPDPCFEEFIPR